LRRATELDREQALELRVAVLLDHEDSLVLLDELGHLVSEWVGAYPAVVDLNATRRDSVERLADRTLRAADADESPLRRLGRASDDRLRNELRGRAPLLSEPIDELHAYARVLRIN